MPEHAGAAPSAELRGDGERWYGGCIERWGYQEGSRAWSHLPPEVLIHGVEGADLCGDELDHRRPECRGGSVLPSGGAPASEAGGGGSAADLGWRKAAGSGGKRLGWRGRVGRAHLGESEQVGGRSGDDT